jgi:hypothetical protein
MIVDVFKLIFNHGLYFDQMDVFIHKLVIKQTALYYTQNNKNEINLCFYELF